MKGKEGRIGGEYFVDTMAMQGLGRCSLELSSCRVTSDESNS